MGVKTLTPCVIVVCRSFLANSTEVWSRCRYRQQFLVKIFVVGDFCSRAYINSRIGNDDDDTRKIDHERVYSRTLCTSAATKRPRLFGHLMISPCCMDTDG